MAYRFKIQVTRNGTYNNVPLSTDMVVEIHSNQLNPLSNPQSRDVIQERFLSIYGVDLKKANALGAGSLKIERIR